MKKLFTFLASITLSVMLFAQAPQSFSYQTVIRDASWTVLDNQSVGIKISILEDVANGNVVYEETHSATTSTIGLVNLSVGGGVVVNGVFNTIDWGNHNYFIEVAVDVTGGTSYIVMGTTQLRSVPYALYAETSGTPGTPGPQGIAGVDGVDGTNGVDGAPGVDGTNGIDAVVDYDSLANLIIVDSTFTANVSGGMYLECVDMGVSVMCAGLGLDPSVTLSSPNNYAYSVHNDDYLNNNNYIDVPHWRKFEIVGLGNSLANGGELMFKCRQQGSPSTDIYPQINYITPELANGSVYFYFIGTEGSTGNCVNEVNIAMSVPLSHSLVVYNSSTWGNNWQSNNKTFFEIFYESDNGFKSTGIIFDRN
jgi:hypothetical protein